MGPNLKKLCSDLTLDQSLALYDQVLKSKSKEDLRRLCKEDLFFLLVIAFKRKDVIDPWLYDRCREVEADPDENLDLWAREHYKSTIITYALTIQDILNDPEVTVGIFSYSRPIAKAFLDQIKRELESNQFLKDLFPDILYTEPHKEAPKWSLDHGIIVRRKSNPKEATVEAWGLVDGQPTSKHFSLMIYDDVVTVTSVSTPEQIKKVTDSWALSKNLGAKGGKTRTIGTRYHANDTYAAMIARKSIQKERVYAPTDLGQEDFLVQGNPVLLTRPALKKKREDMGPYIYACQMLQNPQADKVMGFKEEWLHFYERLRNFHGWNFYITVDPASEKKKKENPDPDYTVIWVHGLAPDRNYYLVDGIRDRLNLPERTRKLFEFHRKWRPIRVGYEKYGMQADIEHIKYIMEEQNYRFEIVPLGGQTPKPDRIRRLVPIYEQGRYWLPTTLMYVDTEKNARDFVREFVEDEYTPFPVSVHDDMFDCASRILDAELEARFPAPQQMGVPSITMDRDPDRCQTEYDVLAG